MAIMVFPSATDRPLRKTLERFRIKGDLG